MELHINTGRALLVVVLTLLGVILINVAIYYSVKGKGTIGQIEMMRKAAKQARNPWEVEDKALAELSDLVKKLKQEPGQAPPTDESQENKAGKL
jgi:hypothetical protein